MEKLNSLFNLVRNYLKHYLPLECKSGKNTIRSYQKSLELLFDYVKAQKNVPLAKVTLEMIDRNMLSSFLDYLENERKCSPATRNHRLHSIRAFYAYAAENDITAIAHYEEILKVNSAKVAEKLVRHMSEEAVKTIISQTDTSTLKGLRDMFIMLFLYKTGARIQEALDIKLRDIQFGKTPSVTLFGKPNNKPRIVPLRENTAQHLKEYIKMFHPDEGIYSDAYLFYTARSGVAKKRMTEDNARDFIRKYGISARIVCAEVPENVHPHLFRHSCAMSLYQSGVHLALIAEWLGHANLETTLIYAHADTEIKRKAIEKAIPKDTPLAEHANAERYKISDENTLKILCGLR
ncbi:MAG: site-specific integrase [Oscillospiraceae bacterium]|jgi:site-specific recombinase XerD|nr:site-specific integrase [Oscillospiraceae bacterium]